MKIIVVGGGKIGETLVEQLAREGHDLVLIDNQQRVIDETENRLDVMGVYGNGALPSGADGGRGAPGRSADRCDQFG